MEHNSIVITLSLQEIQRLEMIIVDNDKDDALLFVKELRRRAQEFLNKGLKSHLDT